MSRPEMRPAHESLLREMRQVDTIDIIKAAHGVDQELARLAASLLDEDLREQVLAVQSNWRDIAYAISGTVCGVAMKNVQEPGRRRGRGPGRQKKTEHDDPARMARREESVRTADGTTNDSAAQP